MIGLGERFPQFKLKALVSLEEGKEYEEIGTDLLVEGEDVWTVFFWWPKDFTAICPTEVVGFNESFPDFQERNVRILGASTDSHYLHLAWRRSTPELQAVRYPLLADPEFQLSKSLGILDEEEGIAYRATYIIDPEGIIRWISVYDLHVGRSIDEVLRVVDALLTEEHCACNWRKGEPTLPPPL